VTQPPQRATRVTLSEARADLNFISQGHNRLTPFMHIIQDPDRDPTPSTCDAIVTEGVIEGHRSPIFF
jgi:hypothetical protein